MEQVRVVSEVVRTMKDNLRNVNNQLLSYNRPLLQRKNKPVIKDEFEREHKVSIILFKNIFIFNIICIYSY